MVRFFTSSKDDKLQRSALSEEVEPRIGRIPFKGRYHKLPRKFEQDYELTSTTLGKGYNGVVRLASNTPSGCSGKQHFAVKSFKTAGLTQHKREQLNAEIEIFLCMDHPHIARLVDVYEAANVITIVMECAEGGELFDRVTQRRFSEDEAAAATRQILLALNYIHSHSIVHRDLKLENILYDTKGGNHLKLIDFGFSKFNDSSHRLHTSCGTLAYIAPEVLNRSYTSQCDLWSLGVICFILLSGHMPFYGSGTVIQDIITSGAYTMKPVHWKSVSEVAKDFTRSLLTLDPTARLTAKTALEHIWIARRVKESTPEMDSSIIDALLLWRTAPKFHRACMLMMAWLLTNEQQAQVRDYFLALDTNHDGVISFEELHNVMVNSFETAETEVHQVFELLDTTHHREIHYSEFLAAMMASRIELTDDLLQTTFHHFDTDNSGDISVEDFRTLLGNSFEGESVESLHQCFLSEATIEASSSELKYADFASYARACAPKMTVSVTPRGHRHSFAPKLLAAIQKRLPATPRGVGLKEGSPITPASPEAVGFKQSPPGASGAAPQRIPSAAVLSMVSGEAQAHQPHPTLAPLFPSVPADEAWQDAVDSARHPLPLPSEFCSVSPVARLPSLLTHTAVAQSPTAESPFSAKAAKFYSLSKPEQSPVQSPFTSKGAPDHQLGDYRLRADTLQGETDKACCTLQ
jgi:calcium-dependent protein kinase